MTLFGEVSPQLAADIREVRFVVFDFDGVFTDNHVYVDENGAESVRCWRGDGLGLHALRRLGIGMCIVSTETNKVVSARARKLNVECVQGSPDKLVEVDILCRRHGLAREQLAFIGNDTNDRTCLEVVRLPIVVADAHPDVIQIARYQTRTAGGKGAVREVCDLFSHVLARP